MVQVLQGNPQAIHSFAEFAGAFRRRFPVCRPEIIAVGPAIAHNAGEQIAISAADLRATHAAAVAASAVVEPCDTVDRCEALFQAVTGPPLLAARIAQSELVGERLERDLRLLTEEGDGDDDEEQAEDAPADVPHQPAAHVAPLSRPWRVARAASPAGFSPGEAAGRPVQPV